MILVTKRHLHLCPDFSPPLISHFCLPRWLYSGIRYHLRVCQHKGLEHSEESLQQLHEARRKDEASNRRQQAAVCQSHCHALPRSRYRPRFSISSFSFNVVALYLSAFLPVSHVVASCGGRWRRGRQVPQVPTPFAVSSSPLTRLKLSLHLYLSFSCMCFPAVVSRVVSPFPYRLRVSLWCLWCRADVTQCR